MIPVDLEEPVGRAAIDHVRGTVAVAATASLVPGLTRVGAGVDLGASAAAAHALAGEHIGKRALIAPVLHEAGSAGQTVVYTVGT